MRALSNNLKNSYYALKKSRLYTKQEIDDDSLSFFEYMINKSLPVNDNDNIIYYFVKSLYYNNKQKFYNFIDNSTNECLILYTDNVSILKHFNLLKKINLKWDPNLKKYFCSKFNDENNQINNNISEYIFIEESLDLTKDDTIYDETEFINNQLKYL